MMNGPGKSDSAIRAVKPANKAASAAAEWAEQRAGTKGNTGQPHTRRTQSRDSVSQGLDRVRHAALPSNTRGRSRMPELGTYGSVRGVPGNGHPYRDHSGNGIRCHGACSSTTPRWTAMSSRLTRAGSRVPLGIRKRKCPTTRATTASVCMATTVRTGNYWAYRGE